MAMYTCAIPFKSLLFEIRKKANNNPIMDPSNRDVIVNCNVMTIAFRNVGYVDMKISITVITSISQFIFV